jgi:hypothetical protein
VAAEAEATAGAGEVADIGEAADAEEAADVGEVVVSGDTRAARVSSGAAQGRPPASVSRSDLGFQVPWERWGGGARVDVWEADVTSRPKA